MASAEPEEAAREKPEKSSSKGSLQLCPMPWCAQNPPRTASMGNYRRSSTSALDHYLGPGDDNLKKKQQTLYSIIKTCVLVRRRLRFDPDGKLYFMYEPGKQVSSAVRIKNVSRSYVAFKFQTNAPKSCFMRPPNGVLAPKEAILATVMKFVEQPEHAEEKKTTRDKFKIVSLKVKEGAEYAPELFEEQREMVAIEKILQVVFLDPQSSSHELEKLKKRLAEAEALNQVRKKPPENVPKAAAPADGVIDEWKERRERYLARQNEDGIDSL